MSAERILLIGANGQIGSELAQALTDFHGQQNILATDIAPGSRLETVPYAQLDVLDLLALAKVVTEHRVSQIYHLAAVLSAAGERDPQRAWHLNMTGLLNVLETARQFGVQKVFWPSSIAVFGPGTPRELAPQHCVMDPQTVYGITKLAGERWCEYYHRQHGVDVRSLRFPGLISHKTPPGGGTTDYAVEIFHAAKAHEEYRCFVAPETRLPMMYMPDALRATMDLMAAPAASIRIRSSYNVSGMSFTARELAETVRHCVPDFRVSYKPDYRQAIADSWPASIDDSAARLDWGWKPVFDLESIAADMLANMRPAQVAA
ncbi:MAG TPA: NAD-dependent epimerase/dehydratase family protein [Usitatibacter sp.]|nr:NAD-dependent epimerase/dehydratase family protein [Usitatibacter sp.]